MLPWWWLIASSIDERIVGGFVVTENYDYVVRLHANMGDVYGYCAGTIVAPRLVLTAAHCLSITPAVVSIRHYSLHSGNDPCRTRLAVRGQRVHPQFASVYDGYDAALLDIDEVPAHCATPVKVDGGTIWSEASAYYTGMVSGWGSTNVNGHGMSHQLRAVEINLYRREQCNAFVGYTLHETIQCAGFYQTGPAVDACFGDSGGPLIVETAHDGPVLVGIVSWGLPTCAHPTHPGMYARVSALGSDFLGDAVTVAAASNPQTAEACECMDACEHQSSLLAEVCTVRPTCAEGIASWHTAEWWRVCGRVEDDDEPPTRPPIRPVTSSAPKRRPSPSPGLWALVALPVILLAAPGLRWSSTRFPRAQTG